MTPRFPEEDRERWQIILMQKSPMLNFAKFAGSMCAGAAPLLSSWQVKVTSLDARKSEWSPPALNVKSLQVATLMVMVVFAFASGQMSVQLKRCSASAIVPRVKKEPPWTLRLSVEVQRPIRPMQEPSNL
jgi:hypothetical protein